MKRYVLVGFLALLLSSAACAQDDDYKVEITGDYSYVHANPQNNNIIPTFSLNGGRLFSRLLFQQIHWG